MKKFIVVTIVLFMSAVAFAQKSLVPPAAVKAAFEKKFPGATAVTWSKESKNEYEAEFSHGGFKIAANFTTAGKWVVTETALSLTDMPQAVQDAFKSKGAASVILAEKVEKPGLATSYEIAYKLGKKTAEVIYGANGKEIKGKAEKEEKEDKD